MDSGFKPSIAINIIDHYRFEDARSLKPKIFYRGIRNGEPNEIDLNKVYPNDIHGFWLTDNLNAAQSFAGIYITSPQERRVVFELQIPESWAEKTWLNHHPFPYRNVSKLEDFILQVGIIKLNPANHSFATEEWHPVEEFKHLYLRDKKEVKGRIVTPREKYWWE